MPELLSYGTSVYNSSGWTGPSDALGAPNGVYATANTSGAVLRCRVAGFSALPDTARINRVMVGMRYRYPSATGGAILQLASTTGTVDPVVMTLATSSSLVTLVQDVELERPGSGFTVSAIKDADFRVTISKQGSGQTDVDAVWVRVIYDEPETTSYGTSLAVGGWTNTPNNLIGPPDGSVAFTASNSQSGTYRAAGHSELASDATLVRVVLGLLVRGTPTGATTSIQLSTDVGSVDTTEKTYTANDLLWHITEFEMDVSKFTVSGLKTPGLAVKVTKGGVASANSIADAFWVRAIYAVATSRAKRWSGSAWVDAPVKRWDGSQWVTPTVKRWNGSAWV